MKRILLALLLITGVLTLSSCKGKKELTGGNVGEVKLEKGDKYAVMSVRDFGDIKMKLFPEIAPVAVQNFIDLAESGYYDGKVFHRIVEDFMIQGGSPNGDGLSDPNSKTFGIEPAYNARHFYGALCMAKSSLGCSEQFYIVNSKIPQKFYDLEELETELNNLKKLIGESGSVEKREYYQYYYDTYTVWYDYTKNSTDEIAEKYKNGGTILLDGEYTVFGQTVEGFDVIDKISAVEVTDNGNEEKSLPVKEVVIDAVKIFTAE